MACSVEKFLSRNVVFSPPAANIAKPSPSACLLDQHSNELLQEYLPELSMLKTAYKSTGDGNCLFNSVSIAVYGHETYKLSTELRYWSCLELISNITYYEELQTSSLKIVCGELIETVFDCATAGTASSLFTIAALCNILQRPITSIYPPCNGIEDGAYEVLHDHTFSPRVINNIVRAPIRIMWTHTSTTEQGTWTPNHFVPLMENLQTSRGNNVNIVNGSIKTNPKRDHNKYKSGKFLVTT